MTEIPSLFSLARLMAKRLVDEPQTDEYRWAQITLEDLALELTRLLNVVDAAVPMSRLPFPVSSDERDEWRVCQQKLKEALARGER